MFVFVLFNKAETMNLIIKDVFCMRYGFADLSRLLSRAVHVSLVEIRIAVKLNQVVMEKS